MYVLHSKALIISTTIGKVFGANCLEDTKAYRRGVLQSHHITLKKTDQNYFC